MLPINWNPTRRTLRQFAAIWIVFFALAGGWLFFRKGWREAAVVVWAVATPVGLAGYGLPRFMRVVYVGMSCVTWPIGWLVSRAVLTTVYVLVFTPIGIAMRLMGRDPLCTRFDREGSSYWVTRRPTPDRRTYWRQF